MSMCILADCRLC